MAELRVSLSLWRALQSMQHGKAKTRRGGFFWPFRIPFECRPGDGRSSWSWALPALQSGCRL